MNIEERLEALTQTVELISAMQRDNEKRFTQIAAMFESALDSIKRLESIALAHEQRLDDLQG
jgi:hypothetical protein